MKRGGPLYNDLLPNLFRLEYSKITALLCRHFGLDHIEIAEDIASETFLKASDAWAIHGIPENPTAWLYTVAKNKAKDYHRHQAIFETKITETIKSADIQSEQDLDFTDRTIEDSQLAMIFAVCNPGNAPASQICLALQILCGFSVEEIASAFLTKTGTIKKRLHRARTRLRNDDFQLRPLNEAEIISRLETVLSTLYLLFNEGYFSKTHQHLIRTDLCAEAVRLGLILTEHPLTNTPQAGALLALMCYQSSRLNARSDDQGGTILFEQQDKSLWDQELIDKGNYYFVNACNGSDISKYHLEAGIAYWHTTPTDENKWEHILSLYDQLMLIARSPMTALNRIFAFGKVYGPQKAIVEARKLSLPESNYYHELMGYLHAGSDAGTAIDHYKKAIALSKSKAEKQTLTKEIERLMQTKTAR